MQEKELINRGNNLMTVAFLGALAISAFVEIMMEKDLIDKFDDSLVVILGIILVFWYFSKNNKYMHSYVPFILVTGAFLVKVLAIIIELDDPASVGDDFGMILPILAMSIITFIVVKRAGKQAG